MALTLTQTAKVTKRAFLFSAIGLFLSLLGVVGYQLWYTNWYLPHKPPPVIKPEVTFGLLPSPKFISSPTTSSNFSYSIATTTGGLPSFPKLLKVYFIPQIGTTFLAPDKATSLATSFGFTQGPTITNQTTYSFADSLGSQFTIDLNTNKFSFSREATPSAQPTVDTLPNQDQLVADFRNYLGTKGLINDDLKSGPSRVAYDSPQIKDSQTALISLWPKDFDNLPIVTADFNTGLVKTTINKLADQNLRYISLEYTYWSPDPTHSSTYPIKSADAALADLKNGQGSIVIEPQSPQVSITSVKLAYFESDNYSPYLIPIYVFEGDGFVAYVNAITPDWLSKNQ